VTADDIMEYDLDSKPVDAKGRGSYKERFIHGEIYKVRPDVNAVIHSHSPTIVPFSVTKYPLKPILHNAAFLGDGPPIFDTRDAAGPTNLLVETPALGKAMAQTLGKANIVLMRGHGDTVVGPNVRLATFWAIYAEVNARQLAQAIAIGRPITFIEGEEQKLTHDTMATAYERPWQMWKREALRSK
jgi:ribulose-5-phosphate 4-epimerase/fuculose-1-phosphate aldolase